MLAVPDRFKERVREAEEEDVLDRRLAEVVVDAETALLREHAVQRLVQRPGRLQVAPKRLLDDDAPALCKAHAAELVDDRREQLRRDREVVDRAPGARERVAQRDVGPRVVVGAPDIADERRKLLVSRGIEPLRAGHQAVPHTLAELLSGPVLTCDADDRHLQLARLDHALQRRDDVLERQVSSDPEDDNRIALLALSAHASPRPAARRGRRTARATDDGVSAPSHAPLREKRSERPAVTASRRNAPPWSIPTTTIISETPNPNAWIRAHRRVVTARARASHARLPTAAPTASSCQLARGKEDDDGEVVEAAREAPRAETTASRRPTARRDAPRSGRRSSRRGG